MSNRYVHPFQQSFVNPVTGAPLAGGKLNFYQSGTTTPQATYSDRALTIPNTNPVILDASGFSGNIFLQNLAYNVVLTDSNNVQVWQADPVYTSDFSTFAQVQSVNGNPNGQLAGTQGTLTTPASMAWDFTNQILYICTLSGTTSTAAWVAVNAPTTQSFVAPPTGYLTPTSGVPVITADATSVTSIFYTAMVGNTVPIFGGSTFSQQQFASDLQLTLTAAHAANTIYDVLVFLNSGVLTLVTGPAWATSTPGSGARGTGPGTTQLQRVNGIRVNAVQITGRNGANTFTIPASQATYLGSIWTDGTAGQVTCHRSWGQNRKFGVYNEYNKAPITLQAGDNTASWTNAGLWRASNNTPNAYSANVFNFGSGTAANGVSVLLGQAEEQVNVRFNQVIGNGSSAQSGTALNGIGVNTITVPSGRVGQVQFSTPTINSAFILEGHSEFIQVPILGVMNFACIEQDQAGTSMAGLGTIANMMMTAMYRG